ncbi:hypothetical protein [Aquimarina aggregata]|nr:hypothetical protein [Aquimarina aggregata]
MNSVSAIVLGTSGGTAVVGSCDTSFTKRYFEAIGHRWVTTDKTA